MTEVECLSHRSVQSGVLCTQLFQSCPTLRGSMDCSLPVSSVRGILQVRTLEGGVAMSFSRGSSPPRDQTCVSYVSCTGEFFPTNAIWEAQILVESELHRARSRGARSQEAGVVLQSAVRVEAVLEHCQCHASWPGRGTDRGRAFLVEGRVRAKAQKNGKPSPRSPSSHQCHLYSPRPESPARLFPLLPHTA